MIQYEGKYFLVDCGDGTNRNLYEGGSDEIKQERIEEINKTFKGKIELLKRQLNL
jgi:hypothetical protein